MDDTSSRKAIKDIALDLLVRRGYRGMSFGDIAAEIGGTRANIHYHFGSKAALVDEVLADYVEATLDALRLVWGDGAGSFADRIEKMLFYSRQRFRTFNSGKGRVQPWSLISRLRQDEDLLELAGRERLRGFTAELHRIFTTAIATAQVTGEIGSAQSAAGLARLLVAIADNAAPITLAEGSFASLEATYRSFVDLAAPGPAGRGD
jgi:AcrR family transcriptional regulator